MSSSAPGRRLQVGDEVIVDGAASVQFFGTRRIVLRVTKISPATTTDLFAWLDGYVLDAHGEAIERRSVFVRLGGLRPAVRTAPTAKRKRAA